MVEEFWTRFAEETGIDGSYTAWAFGDDSTPELATELALLVRDGPKRATTGLLSDYDEGTDSADYPKQGDLSLILDGSAKPICVIRTTNIEIRAFGEVDEQFAWDEGEGDRSLASWRDAHQRYFGVVGTPVDELTPVVLERFELLYPLASAGEDDS